jgi:3-hydroxybutyryl-CoA dehydrogenase
LGRGIASVLAKNGCPVTLYDASADVLDSAQALVSKCAVPGLIVRTAATLEEAVAEAEFVIEAVLENLELKQEIFERVAAANSSAILMSNSSVLPIGLIAQRATLQHRTVGTHWWNPPDLIPVVELIRGPATSNRTLQRSVELLTKLGKRPVHVSRDVPGFVGNRLQHALWREALGLVSQGVCDPATVDMLVSTTLGVSLAQRGPIAEMNRMGLALVASEFEEVLPTLINEQTPARALRDKVKAGALGAKSGQGFLTWPAGARERCGVRLQRHVEERLRSGVPDPNANFAVTSQLSPTDLDQAARLTLALWREALALIADGVCDAATVDLMACHTIGLRLAVMAPMENADYVGLDLTLAIHQAVFPTLSVCTEVSPLLRAKISAGGFL